MRAFRVSNVQRRRVIHSLVFFPALALAFYTAPAEEIHEFARLERSTEEREAFLGNSVAVAGDFIVAGAQGHDQGLFNTGAAYVFAEPPGGWTGVVTESAVLVAGNAAYNDRFGWDVAAEGDVVVVTASLADPNGTDSGGAYVFIKPSAGWTGTLNEDAWLLPNDGAAGDWFGCDVAIEGDTVVIGARYDDDNGDSSGAAYVFVEPPGGWSGTIYQNAKLIGTNIVADDQLGASVSISGDVIVVGAPRRDYYDIDSGAVYLFEKPPGGWSGTVNQAAVLIPSDGTILDMFGEAVSIVGDHVLVGAEGDGPSGSQSGSAYWFTEPATGWSGFVTETAFLTAADAGPNARFGRSVAACELGAIIGAPFDEQLAWQAGAAYAVPRSGAGWTGPMTVDRKMVASDLTEGDQLGHVVVVHRDLALVGSPSHECLIEPRCGMVYVFKAPWLFGDGFESGDVTAWAWTTAL